MSHTNDEMAMIMGKAILKELEKNQLDITWNKNTPKPKTENFVVVISSLGDGFDFVGPFNNEESARVFAKSKDNRAISSYTPQLYPMLHPEDA